MAYIHTLLLLADTQLDGKDPNAAMKSLSEAERRLSNHPNDLAARARLLAFRGRALLLAEPPRPDNAVVVLRDAIEKSRALPPGHAAHLPAVFFHLAQALIGLDDLEGALCAAQEAVRLDTARLGPDHPEVATDMDLVGRLRILIRIRNRKI